MTTISGAITADVKGRISRQAHATSIARTIVLLLIALCLTRPSNAACQEPEPPIPVDSTPLADLLSPEDKVAVGSTANDPKKAVEVYLHISDTHLDLALATIKKNDHKTSERELDIYKKSLSKASELAFGLHDKKRSFAKRVEQAVYKQIRTLEAIGKLFPPERSPFAEAAMRHAKQIRVQALNAAFAAGDVLKEPEKEKEPGPNDELIDDELQPRLFPFRLEATSREFVVDLSKLSGSGPMLQSTSDYLTEEEDNHVREAQSPDDRTKVFMKIAERRLALLTGPPPSASTTPPPDKKVDKKAQKKSQEKAEEFEKEWGTLPNLSRAELLKHYSRAIDECMAKLEDAYERNPKSNAFAKALAALREGTEHHLATLRSLSGQMTTDEERRALTEAIDEAETANKGAQNPPSHK